MFGALTRVIVKNNKNCLFVILKPEVYEAMQIDKYILIGNNKIEYFSASLHKCAAGKFKVPYMSVIEVPPLGGRLMGATAGGGSGLDANDAFGGEEGEVDEGWNDDEDE